MQCLNVHTVVYMIFILYDNKKDICLRQLDSTSIWIFVVVHETLLSEVDWNNSRWTYVSLGLKTDRHVYNWWLVC